MNDRPDEPQADLLGPRLKAALGPMPPRLSSRLDRLTHAGLGAKRPEQTPVPIWREVAPRLAVVAMLFVLLAGLLPRLLGWLTNASPAWARAVAVVPTLARSPAVVSLLLPVAVLLALEAVRGAPTVRRWLT
jgi:hypothetical protein